MTFKKPNTHKEFKTEEIPKLNQNLDVAFSHKIESLHKRNGTSISPFPYQALETGEITFSPTGSAVASLTYGFFNTFSSMMFASAQAKSTLVSAHITDLTVSSVTVSIRLIDSSGAISSVVPGNITVWYQVIGSSP